MLCSPTLHVAIQTTTHLDYEGVCPSHSNVADEIVDLRTLFPLNLDQLHCSHQMNSLLLGMSPLVECADK
jgi:hypothetical protein